MKMIVADNVDELWLWLKRIVPDLNWKKAQVFSVKEFRNKRSNDQNSLYFMWLTALANYLGEDKDELHIAYARKFLPWKEVVLPGSLSYWERGHTPDEDTLEFSKYMNDIHNHAYSFHNFFLPSSDDPVFKTFVEQYKYISKGMEIKYS